MPEDRGPLARHLTALKQRSGLSYAEWGRASHVSGSTLHRYCSGATVPPDYRTVVAVATACSAGDGELVELLAQWKAASGQAVGPDLVAPVVPEAAPPASRSRRLLRPGTLSAVSAGLVLVLVLALVTASGTEIGTVPARQQITGPAWQREQPLAPSLFGVTVSSASGVMPSFQVGSLRFWDSRTRWANLQPRRDTYDWHVLDRLADGARKSGLPSTLVLGGTPEWAAPEGRKAPYADGSRSAPPGDLAGWEQFVRALATRYRGRIDAYEVWAHANDQRYFSGSIETLVEMTRLAARAIKAADPEAVVVCPSIARLWTDEGRAVLRRFAGLRGYDHCDVAGINLSQQTAADPPETMLGRLQQIDGAFHDVGVHPRLWNTGVTYEYVRDERLDERRAIDYATRFYLVAIYGSGFGLERAYFYNWGSGSLPIALQAVGGAPTRAALAVQELQRWLTRTSTRSCGHGLALDLPAAVWQCEFTADDGRLLTIRWTDEGTAMTPAPAHTRELRELDGTGRPLHAGDTVTVSGTPVLIVGQPGS
ncbi:helix-turn-helix domain-containing protein [Amycolatopsis sp. PS_44_ISF1]|uniref:helix-turn-helix domain-containing protein n=1 Tax=Amycolatopsis sp. PS_44_ISF1 TaxID=2974917 RepID=UPI0028DFCE73|nr:helix-turn-helix domain-containing protein [Amycolatopsis sp. PS_44_ISF1]MDT8914672.1 helix-turn-helix domain-containing protein [Amycolatopsis sp. PS_44_ISF1]